MTETVNAALEPQFGALVRSRVRWKQFPEPVVEGVVHNVERARPVPGEEHECQFL